MSIFRRILLFLLLFLPFPALAQVPKDRGRLGEAPKTFPRVPEDAVDSVVAVIDGEPMTMNDLQEYVRRRQNEMGAGFSISEDTFLRGSMTGKKLLQDFIQERMLEREAQSAEISAAQEDIDLYLQEVQKQNNVDKNTFQEILRSRGIRFDAYVEQVRRDIIRSRLIAMKVRGKINVIDEDVYRYVKKGGKIGMGRGSSSVHFEQLSEKAVSDDPDDGERVREKFERLRGETNSSGSLRELNEQLYADLGYIRLSDLRTELEQEARKLNAGEVSPVICYESTCAILRRIPEDEEQNTTVDVSDSEKDKVKKQLFEERFQTALETYLQQELPKKYNVEVKW